jgi:hypothetical protein
MPPGIAMLHRPNPEFYKKQVKNKKMQTPFLWRRAVMGFDPFPVGPGLHGTNPVHVFQVPVNGGG